MELLPKPHEMTLGDLQDLAEGGDARADALLDALSDEASRMFAANVSISLSEWRLLPLLDREVLAVVGRVRSRGGA